MASRQTGLQAATSPLYEQYLKLLRVGESYGDNHEAALKECTKRLKKHPRSPALLLWKAKELVELGRDEELLALLRSLCSLSPAIQELKMVGHVHEMLLESAGPDTSVSRPDLIKLWRRAIEESNKANKLVLAKSWLWTSVQHACWSDASLAVNEIIQREDVNTWQAFRLVVASMEDFSAGKVAQVPSYKLIWILTDKFMTANIATPVGVFEPKTTRDLRVVYDIVTQAIKNGIVITEVNPNAWSDRDDIDQGASLSEIEFVVKKMELLAHFRQWKALYRYCVQFVTEEAWCQELKVWEYLMQAEDALKSDSTSAETNKWGRYTVEELIVQSLKKQSKSRTAMRMKILVDMPPGQSPTVDTVAAYFDAFSDQYHCFEDLRPLIKRFPDDRALEFLSHITQTSSFSLNIFRDEPHKLHASMKSTLAKLNILKFIYCLSASKSSDSTAIELFAAETIRFYEESIRRKPVEDEATSYEEDDACILGVMALLKLQKLDEERGRGQARIPLIRAAALLIRAAQTSPKNQDILQLWVRLFQHLGLHSLAIGGYRSLRIKEMLNQTLSYLLYTRISTQHPFAANHSSEEDRFEPRKELKSVLDYYFKALRQANKFLGGDGNVTQPDTIMDFQELKSSFYKSFTRKICLLERRRIARVSGLPCDPEGYTEALQDIWAEDSIDNRDFKTMPDYESVEDHWLNLLIRGSTKAPSQYWLAVFTEIEHLACLVTDQKPLLKSWTPLTLDEKHNNELTVWEQRIAAAWIDLRPLIRNIKLGPSAEPLDLGAELTGTSCIERFLDAHPVEIFAHSTDTLLPPCLHSFFLRLEYLSTAAKLSQYALKQPSEQLKKHAADFKRIFLAVMKYHIAMRTWAAARLNALSDDKAAEAVERAILSGATEVEGKGNGVEERLGKLGVGGDHGAAEALNATFAEVFAPGMGSDLKMISRMMVGSAAEAMTGFLQVKKL